MKKVYAFLASSMILLSSSLFAAGNRYYVKQAADGGDDAACGVTWASAFATIQQALESTAVGDEIWVAKGTYTPTKRPGPNSGSGDQNLTILLRPGVSLFGSFDIGETEKETRDFISNQTILTSVDGIGQLHIVSAVENLGNITIDGFKIENGNATIVSQSSFTPYSGVTNVQISRSRGGGMILNDVGGNVKLKNLIIEHCSSNSFGGGIYVTGTSSLLSLESVSFIENTSITSSGGAIYLDNIAGAVFNNVIFKGNTAIKDGGAVYVSTDKIDTDIKVSRSKFIANKASELNGGAVYLNAASNSLVSKFDNSIFAGNEAMKTGGALHIIGNVKMYSYNNTFYNNRAQKVSSVAKEGVGGVLALDNHSVYGGLTRLYIYNSIMFGNTTANTITTNTNDFYFDPARPELSSVQVEIKNNITQDYSGGTANIPAVNPLFLSTAYASADFLKIDESSPAINAGDNAYVLPENTTDYAGNARIQLVTADIGAFESAVSALLVNLLNFTADKENNTVRLKWSTASEQKNSFFTVERSSDGKSYSLLTTVNGAGNSAVRLDYFLLDKEPIVGLNYYRLSQTDLNGVSKSLGIMILDFELIGSKVSLYPNSASDEVMINHAGKIFTSGKVVDVSGKVQKEFNISGNTTRLAVSDLKSGVYIIVLVGNDPTETLRMVKR